MFISNSLTSGDGAEPQYYVTTKSVHFGKTCGGSIFSRSIYSAADCKQGSVEMKCGWKLQCPCVPHLRKVLRFLAGYKCYLAVIYDLVSYIITNCTILYKHQQIATILIEPTQVESSWLRFWTNKSSWNSEGMRYPIREIFKIQIANEMKLRQDPGNTCWHLLLKKIWTNFGYQN